MGDFVSYAHGIHIKGLELRRFWDALIGFVYLWASDSHKWNKLAMIYLLLKNTPFICTSLSGAILFFFSKID